MLNSIRVLIVDDEEIFVQSLTRVLRTRGMVVRGVYNGLSAVEAICAEEFDVIILDMRMPGMDGLETLQAIREKDSLTPVILLTGHEDIERVRMALKNGVMEFLLKPCDIEYLVAAIENASERKAITKEFSPTEKS
jgi:DNA-binding NtrC family response regulator